MKHRFFSLLTLFLCLTFFKPVLSSADEDRPWVLSLGLNVLDPRESEDWDGGSGFEVQIQKWFGDEFGIALSVGRENWDLKSTRRTGTGTRDFVIDSTSVTGDVDIT
ncbi:MAG: hypothetical protein AAF492_09810, partial [Verrucomicrobiota bacterium]